MRKLTKRIDDTLFNESLRRAIMHGRMLHGDRSGGRIGRTVRALRRERTLSEEEFLYTTEVPRFVGGTTGRSGTKWLITLLSRHLGGDPVVIGEHGAFVMGILRNAPYEYYQHGGNEKGRESYVEYFLQLVRTWLFRRRTVYTGGIKGLVRYIPRRAIDLAGEALKRDLPQLHTLPEIEKRFGDFYLHLHNYHAAVIHGAPAEWVNKEPPYGRHADQLVSMVPNARLVVLAREGRASALSIYKRGWMNSIRGCMERWKEFTEMTLDAIDRAPPGPIKLVKYEDMVLEFEKTLSEVFSHFQLPTELAARIASSDDERTRPRTESLERWKAEIPKEDLDWFDRECGDLMQRLGYRG
jgi:hypothetical protein